MSHLPQPPIIRPYRSTMYVDVAYCYQPSSEVCRSDTLVSCAKTAELIEMPFGLRTGMGPRNHVYNDGGPDSPMGMGNFGERCANCKVLGLSAVSCAKTAEPPFGCGFGWAEGSTSSIYSPGGANVSSWEGTLMQPDEYGCRALSAAGPTVWNSLPDFIWTDQSDRHDMTDCT